MLPDWVWNDDDRRLMEAALDEARAAGKRGEVPVGCVIARAGAIVARTGNRREEQCDPTAHAELLALREAGAGSRDWRLGGTTLYVTLEPCPMCVAACRQARLDLVVWAAEDPVLGACGTVADLAADLRLGPPLAHRGGLLADDSRRLLRAFFANSRTSS
jgi:tRNA(adenine34) deaminase